MIKLHKLPELPFIHCSQRNDIVEQLLEIIHIHELNDKILKDEIERLNGVVAELQRRPKKPKVKPSSLEIPHEESKKKKSRKNRGKIPIHRELVVKPEEVPRGAIFKGYHTYVVQDIEIKSFNTLFKLERWETLEGSYVTGKLPMEYEKSHFGPKLKAFILYQYYQGRVTQPRLLQQLKGWKIKISSGELNRLLCSHVDFMDKEEKSAVEMALEQTSYVQTDDTGARHKGKNCTCIEIGNHLFTHFTTATSKSRLQFLEALNTRKLYLFNEASIEYLRQQGSLEQIKLVEKLRGKELGPKKWAFFLSKHREVGAQRAIKEAGVIGALSVRLKEDFTILSDGAAQYKILNHAGCWVHAIRLLEREKPIRNEKADAIIKKLYFLYHHLKRYKKKPTDILKRRLSLYFDQICDLTAGSKSFEGALLRFSKNKRDLLRVLEKPEIPLHNNLSENDLREYVVRRKISYGTRSDLGKKARDIFLSLMKTCAKLQVNFWDFLVDRMRRCHENIPPLAQLIKKQSLVTSIF